MYSLCRFLRLKPYMKSVMAASPFRLIVTFTSMCCMWALKSSCEFRMTSRTQYVLNKKTLLICKINSAEVL